MDQAIDLTGSGWALGHQHFQLGIGFVRDFVFFEKQGEHCGENLVIVDENKIKIAGIGLIGIEVERTPMKDFFCVWIFAQTILQNIAGSLVVQGFFQVKALVCHVLENHNLDP